jgi:cation diffusion facilitator CzcD-associated flavoprotein CzcO
MVDIAVIGAGAAGLVATRHLLRCGFKPIVFESSQAVGGSWNSKETETTDAGSSSSPLVMRQRPRPPPRPPLSQTSSSLSSPGKMWDNLSPNLSKYTSCFSEFPWDPETPLFPSRTDMDDYLKRFAATFVLPDQGNATNEYNEDDDDVKRRENKCVVNLGCTVTRVVQRPTMVKKDNNDNEDDTQVTTTPSIPSTGKAYQVEWIMKGDGDGATRLESSTTTSTTTTLCQQEFDGVVVATGFFSKPHFPDCLQPLLLSLELEQQKNTATHSTTTTTSNPTTTNSKKKKRLIHSSEYKSSHDFENETVAVIGSSFSALEIASDVRLKARHVVTILPHIPWVIPRFVPWKNKKKDDDDPNDTGTEKDDDENNNNKSNNNVGVVPLDWVLYQRSLQRDAPQIPEIIAYDSEEMCRQRHAKLQDLVGTRKQEASGLGIPSASSSSSSSSSSFTPPLVSISDDFLNLVISGKIQAVPGRLASVVDTATTTTTTATTTAPITPSTPTLSLHLEDGTILPGIDRIIACTGYQCSLDFLEDDLLNVLEYNETDGFAPMTLAYEAFHPQVPNLGFVGMYRGPYWGIMDLQARMVAELWSQRYNPSNDTLSHAMEVARQIRSHTPRAQFPHFDYIGYTDTLADQLNLVPSSSSSTTSSGTGYGAGGNFVFPAYYQEDPDLATRIYNEVQEHLQRATEHAGEDMPRRVLSAMVGKWSYHRTITQMSGPPNPQTVAGDVKFSLETSGNANGETSSTTTEAWDTVLYREDGIFTLPSGQTMEVFREYEYIVNQDCIEIYFVENGKRAHLFLSLKFQPQPQQQPKGKTKTNINCNKWVATSDHLCIKDLYKGTFEIVLDGLGASEIIMTYRVKGPAKDYESVTYLWPKT